MGRDKATLPFGRGRLVDHVASCLTRAIESGRGVRAEVLVSGAVEGFHCVPDRALGLGPLGGIASVLDSLRQDSGCDLEETGLLIVPVDMPSLTAESMAALIHFWRFWTETDSNCDGVAFQGQELPILLAVSSKVRQTVDELCRESVTPQLRSIRQLTRLLFISSLDPGSRTEREFLNANTPEDWFGYRQ